MILRRYGHQIVYHAIALNPVCGSRWLVLTEGHMFLYHGNFTYG